MSKDNIIINELIPGEPILQEVKSDSVRITWTVPKVKVHRFQVCYKEKKTKFPLNLKIYETKTEENYATIKGLLENTEYTFQIRGVFGDQEGPYGPVNDKIKTKKSLGTTMLDRCILQDDSQKPYKYKLPTVENKDARNENARSRQFILGKENPHCCDEKIIMLIGSVGSGKSTILDGMINYIMGVKFQDPFRFAMATVESDEKKTYDQAISHTKWITRYKIYPEEDGRINFTLTVIEIPGFGDAGDIQDNAIIHQIQNLFLVSDEQSVLYIDAICFVVKAQDTRITDRQKFMFNSVMSLFGKDLETNICTLITFGDVAEPPVLASLKELKLPFGQLFTFNNSALFAENDVSNNDYTSPLFWEMGYKSFERFFQFDWVVKRNSNLQTKQVMDEREKLRTIIENMKQEVSAGLVALSELKKYRELDKENFLERNFKYTVNETRVEKIGLSPGQHVTNCLNCQITCHEKCTIGHNGDKKKCDAIDSNGYCTVCPGKCYWNQHTNAPYCFKYVTKPVTKTYSEMKTGYENAVGTKSAKTKYIEILASNVKALFEKISNMIKDMNHCKTRLKEIALISDPLWDEEPIDLLILSEEREKQPGYVDRIQMFKETKKITNRSEL